jgi:hypothetical protein
MADIEHIRAKIAELAERRKNVVLSEIQWVVNNLGANGYEVSSKSNSHQTFFRVGGQPFGVCHHHRGSKQIRKCYVDEFLNAMELLGLYES